MKLLCPGLLLKIPIWSTPKDEVFEDSPFFETPEIEVSPELLQKIIDALAKQETEPANPDSLEDRALLVS